MELARDLEKIWALEEILIYFHAIINGDES
jgi:hypothetical protein